MKGEDLISTIHYSLLTIHCFFGGLMRDLLASLNEKSSVIFVLFIILLFFAVAMFLLAIVFTVVYFIKHSKKRGEQQDISIIFPIMLYCLSIPILLGMLGVGIFLK